MDKFTEWLKAERGRASRLAEVLNIRPGAISQWDRVPAERIGDVSRVTGLELHELRPDMFKAPEAAA
jgi:pyruvate kinase